MFAILLKNSLLITGITFAKDANELIDFDSGEMYRKEYEISKPSNILRVDDKIRVEVNDSSHHLSITEQSEKIGEIVIKDNKYFFKPKVKENIVNGKINVFNDLAWLVYRGKKLFSDKKTIKYKIKEGDVIKLGKEWLLVKDIHINENTIKKIKNVKSDENNNILVSYHSQANQSLNLNQDFNELNENVEDQENLISRNNNKENENKENKEKENENKKNENKEKKNKENENKENNNDDLISYTESEKKSEKKNINKKICRICYNDENTNENPLIKPCSCSGSMKYIHYDCLLKWLKTKVLITKSICLNNYYSTYSLDLIECELCKHHLPNYIKHHNKIYSLLELDKTIENQKEKEETDQGIPEKNDININNINYIVFDTITPDKQSNKYRYFVKFDGDTMRIGRGLDMQLILNDISVSRNHISLTLDEDGNIMLEDQNSKFGTLILLQSKCIEILKGRSLNLQVGTNYLEINLKNNSNIFGCCNVEEIDNVNSYEKINSKCIKYDKYCDLLNESVTPENSDNEENKEQKCESQINSEKNLIDMRNNKIKNGMNDVENSSIINNLNQDVTSNKKDLINDSNKEVKKIRIKSIAINSKTNYVGSLNSKDKQERVEQKKINYEMNDDVFVSEGDNNNNKGNEEKKEDSKESEIEIEDEKEEVVNSNENKNS